MDIHLDSDRQMLGRLCEQVLSWLVKRLPPPRVIFDRRGESPYLSRYYLVGDRRSRFGVYLHHFHRGDDEPELHNHPWDWAWSLVLSGGYLEERRAGSGVVYKTVLEPGRVNVIRCTDFHRVEPLTGSAWTLFVVGPKRHGWGFWNQVTGKYKPWREFINELRDPVAFSRSE